MSVIVILFYVITQLSGAAAVDRSVVEFFMELDVPIYEIYGMSECTGPHAVSLPSECNLYTTNGLLYVMVATHI